MGTQPTRKPVFPPRVAPYIDVGAYLLDARAPAATLYLDTLLEGKELMLLTRADQADPAATKQWLAYFRNAGYPCFRIDAPTGAGYEGVLDYLAKLMQQKHAIARQRGIINPVLRMVALGVPNVGKSTFLNQLIGRRRFKTGDKPGITRGYQWVRLFEDVEVLDTPGVLRDPEQLNRRKPYWMLLNLLPYDHSIREEAVDLLLSVLDDRTREKLRKLYKVSAEHFAAEDWWQLVQSIAGKRGIELDDDDAVDTIIRRVVRDFQRGRFGRLTLEEPGVAEITSPVFRRPPEE